MAILWSRRKTGYEASTGPHGEISFRTVYTLKSDTPLENRIAILASGLLPVYGSPHPDCALSTCVKVTPVQNKENPYLWEATCEWNTVHGGENPTEMQKQLDQRRPRWRHKFVKSPMQRFYDLDGKPFFDTAGSPFLPAPNIPIWMDEITITRWQAQCDRQFDRQFLNATNTDTWYDAEPSTALIDDIDAEEIYEKGAYWFIYTYRILVNPKVVLDHGEVIGGWDPCPVLNAGPKSLQDDPDHPGQTIVKPINDDGVYTGQPAPLDMQGYRLWLKPDGSIIDSLGVSIPSFCYLKFRTVNKTAYAPLNLIPPWQEQT